MARIWIPVGFSVAACCLLGVLTGSISQWLTATPGPSEDVVDLSLGMGFLGIFPGLAWGLLERKLEKLGESVAVARRRLFGNLMGGCLGAGALGALGLTVGSVVFGQIMKSVGFRFVAGDTPPLAVAGLLYGGLLGLLLGFVAAFLSHSRKRAS